MRILCKIHQKILYSCFFICLLILISTFFIIIYFHPCIKIANGIIAKTHTLHKHPPKDVSKLLYFINTKKQIQLLVSRRILALCHSKKNGALEFKLQYFLFYQYLGCIYDIDIMQTLFLHFVPSSKGYGINSLANELYDRNLDALSTDQIITLLVIAKNPSYYKRHPGKLQDAVDALVSRYAIVNH